MTQLSLHEIVPAPAAAVWGMLGDLDRARQWPAVDRCQVEGAGIGCVRTMHLIDGAVIRERLEAHDDDTRSYRCEVLEMAHLPLKELRYTVTVREGGLEKCTVDWDVEFQASGAPEDRVRRMLEGIYTSSTASMLEEIRRGGAASENPAAER